MSSAPNSAGSEPSTTDAVPSASPSGARPVKGSRDLTTGSIPRELLMFSLPVLGSSVMQSLNGSINSIWVGRYLGEAALTATSNANIVLFLLLGLVFGISMATSILVGQATGRKDSQKVKEIVGTSSVFFAGLSIAAALFGWLMSPHVLGWMNTPKESMSDAIAYMRVIFLAIPFMYFFNFLMMALRGTGDSRTPFQFMLLSVFIDILMNPLLIFGIGPFPKMGITGAATATLVAQSTALLGMILTLYRKQHVIALKGPDRRYFCVKTELIRTLIAKGVPMGMQMLIISSSAVIMMSLVNRYGSEVTAAFGVASQIWTYVQMPALAIGASVSSMTAQNVGAGRWDRVTRITWTGLGFNIALTGMVIGLIYLLERPIFGLFLPTGSTAIETAVTINQHVAWSFLLFGMTIVLFGTVRATGAVMAPLLILFLSQWLLRLPFAWLGSAQWGQVAVWWSFGLSSLLSLALAAAYYRWGNWRQSHMLREGR